MNSDIKTFRRLVLAMISVLFLSLAASSLAQGKVKLERSKFRVEVTGTYVHDWRLQTVGYPASDRVWTLEEGTVTSGYHTKGKGVLYSGSKLTGDVPKGIPTTLQFSPVGWPRAKMNNVQKVKVKRNLIPACGGELGECTGNEPRGIKTTSRGCRKPDAVLPFSLDYLADKPGIIELDFLYHPSYFEFCGKKFPYFASVTELPDRRRVKGGLGAIDGLEKGQRLFLKNVREWGEVISPETGNQPKRTKTCPAMSGEGTRHCWTSDLTLEITRIR